MTPGPRLRIPLLMAASAAIVLTLSAIQYFLIHNTYELKKDKYYREIRERINEMTGRPEIDSLESQAQENLRELLDSVGSGKTDQRKLRSRIKIANREIETQFERYFSRMLQTQPDLDKVRYKLQYEQIVVDASSRLDTILRLQDQPLVIFGSDFPTDKAFKLNNNETVSISKSSHSEGRQTEEDRRFIVKFSSYIDVSDWEKTIFRQMTGIMSLGIGLIIAVIALFYAVFSTMIRQKKIADIKTDFANNISHELKTPLSSVSLILKSMNLAEVKTNANLMHELLQSLNRQYLKIQHIIDSVLVSAMQMQVPVPLETLDMPRFLQTYAADLRLKERQLNLNLDPAEISLISNQSMIEKILNVLMENAQNYSDAGKPITLKSYTERTSYCIAITDEGKGIAAAHQKEIFEKFYRIPEQNKHTVKGLGLGLSLANEAAAAINGKITLISKPGEGSTFIIKLPL